MFQCKITGPKPSPYMMNFADRDIIMHGCATGCVCFVWVCVFILCVCVGGGIRGGGCGCGCVRNDIRVTFQDSPFDFDGLEIHEQNTGEIIFEKYTRVLCF